MDYSKENEVKQHQAKVQRLNKRDSDDLRDLLKIPAFRKYVWRILTDCGVFESSMADGAYIYFNEGKRDVGLKILSEVASSDDKAIVEMMKKQENQDE